MITLKIKEAMQEYFKLRKEVAKEGLDFLFKTPISSEDNLIIYEG